MSRWSFIIFSLVIFLMALSGCDKGPTSGMGELKMYLSDSPIGFDAVNIVVKEVAVHSDTRGWIVVNDSVRTFNLLLLTNGATTLLGDARLNADHYTQIRLILDSGSNVVVNGVTFPLRVPSGFETGIKLIHEFTLQADYTYELMLDFDASRSINLLGNGTYQLKPVIRVEPKATSGAIVGFVAPVSARAEITAMSTLYTVSTFADTVNGQFRLIALHPDSYTLHIAASDTTAFRDTTLANVQVNAGQTTDVGILTLSHK